MSSKAVDFSPRPLVQWLEWGAKELAFLGEGEARWESEQILETLFGVSRPALYVQAENASHRLPQFFEWVEARKRRTPLAYLLGRTAFWESEFEVEGGVFIPRPETEGLIEAFLKTSGFSKDRGFRFLDLGTGSGNIAVTVAQLFPKARGVATDLSEKALTVARRNAKRLGVSERVEMVQGDGLLAFGKERFDTIFSNPPYVSSADWVQLDPEVRCEPRLALDGGRDGLDFYRRIFGELSCLRRGGSLWVEIGWGEAREVFSLFEKQGFRSTRVFQDHHQIDRIICGMGVRG